MNRTEAQHPFKVIGQRRAMAELALRKAGHPRNPRPLEDVLTPLEYRVGDSNLPKDLHGSRVENASGRMSLRRVIALDERRPDARTRQEQGER